MKCRELTLDREPERLRPRELPWACLAPAADVPFFAGVTASLGIVGTDSDRGKSLSAGNVGK